MNFKAIYGHWLMATARRHELKAYRRKKKAEKLFNSIKGLSQ